MCPQRLFTNTQLFMIAGKRNPTRARCSPDLAGGARAEELQGGRLFSRSSPRKRPCAQGAAGPECSAWATGAPPLSSRRRGAPAVTVRGPDGTRRPQLFPGDAPRSPPQPFSSAPQSAFLSATRLREKSHPPDSDLPRWLSRSSSTCGAGNLTSPKQGSQLARLGARFSLLSPAGTSQKTPPAVDWKMSSPKSRITLESAPSSPQSWTAEFP
ncbi:uncharacterized protein LOC128627099 isoform X2 [Artibeus jamaicensis]|uniref:uncharacterized protein LOC128627099 isoform X2 n=1 Tax=Artibeus jamaicensis TaxID=9417 RepID=UPI00235AB215|nr:uncharacterized protein LOC128627099 isoform X2 [Artibeus jamaicensis]